jgi:hypothetical protein
VTISTSSPTRAGAGREAPCRPFAVNPELQSDVEVLTQSMIDAYTAKSRRLLPVLQPVARHLGRPPKQRRPDHWEQDNYDQGDGGDQVGPAPPRQALTLLQRPALGASRRQDPSFLGTGTRDIPYSCPPENFLPHQLPGALIDPLTSGCSRTALDSGLPDGVDEAMMMDQHAPPQKLLTTRDT